MFPFDGVILDTESKRRMQRESKDDWDDADEFQWQRASLFFIVQSLVM